MSIYKKLLDIQKELKAPKAQYNKFGKYSYRSCEDILESVKLLLDKQQCCLVINDKIVNIEGRYYVEATAKIIDIETGENVSTTAYAREEEIKKGMDGSQITGSASSYARKYALNGLFCIDDTKDSDYTNNGNNVQNKSNNTISEAQAKRMFAIAKDVNVVKEVISKFGYNSSKEIQIKDYQKIIQELETKINK